MKVKDFIDNAGENVIIEIELPVKYVKKFGSIVETHTFKSSCYDDLSEYYDRTVIASEYFEKLPPIYKLTDAANNTDSSSFEGMYRLKIK